MSGTKSIEISNSNTALNCRIFGDGSNNVICFHGFGQDGSVFQSLLKSHADLTLFSIDLPFHGKSIVHDPDQSIDPEEICELIMQILDKCKVDTFAILAFSIGARFVFPIVECFGPRIASITLIAPDGVVPNIWYELATGSRASRFLFKLIMKNHQALNSINKLLKKASLIDSEKNVIVARSVSSSTRAERVYYSWTYLRKLKLNMLRISELAVRHNILIKIVAGKYDRVIPARKLSKAAVGIKNVDYAERPCGHYDLIGKLDMNQQAFSND